MRDWYKILEKISPACFKHLLLLHISTNIILHVVFIQNCNFIESRVSKSYITPFNYQRAMTNESFNHHI